MRNTITVALLLFIGQLVHAADAPARMADKTAAGPGVERYNVVWDSPSKDKSGEMPIGNGDIAAGVYALENGDLYLLLAKNDAINHAGDNFKTGRVRIGLEPNPFAAGKPFRQTLDLPTGSIRIEADGIGIRIWADANRNVFHVEINAPSPVRATARPDPWERLDKGWMLSRPYLFKKPIKDVFTERDGKILWYYTEGERSYFPTELKIYGAGELAKTLPDPYRFNVFGNLLECPGLQLANGVFTGEGRAFDIRIHGLTLQTPQPQDWLAAMEREAQRPMELAADWQRHCQWWRQFWERSWIVASDTTVPASERERLRSEPTVRQTPATPSWAFGSAFRDEKDGAALVAQSYNVFRFLMACQSRGRVPVQFNSGLFSQPLHSKKPLQVPAFQQQPDGTCLSHEDARIWGAARYFQNSRWLYWPLLRSGDFDLVETYFNFYAQRLPLRQALTKIWYGHEGAYWTDCLDYSGVDFACGPHGIPPLKTRPELPKDRAYKQRVHGFWFSFYFTPGLEMLSMMLDRYKLTGDAHFRDEVLLPMARQNLLFFDRHYSRDANGKLRLDPSQVLETWWIAVNPATDVAGLHCVLDELLRLKLGTDEDQKQWRRFRAEIPEVPLRKIAGRTALAPAESYEWKMNFENGELYPVFPFPLFGVVRGNADIVLHTMEHRTAKNSPDGCWRQDEIDWACAGNAAEASKGLVARFRRASCACRFPLYGEINPDTVPDFDHFGAGAVALQHMLLQEGQGTIHLLPAWPAAWDVDFKLHASGGAVVSGSVKNGVLEKWDIQPADRKKDVVVHSPQPAVKVNRFRKN